MIGHRGASTAFRENTVDAFRGAATLGADGVELDVRWTADGVPVVHHDPELPDGGPAIAATPAGDLPAWVPTLADALAACEQPSARSGRPLTVNVEIKSAPGEPGFDPSHPGVPVAVAVIRSHLSPDRTLVSSFDPTALDAVAAAAPELPRALLSIDLADAGRVLTRAAAAGNVAINPWDGFVTADLVDEAHRLGLLVYPWTIDDPDRMAALCAFGVDGIITNVPDVCASVVDSLRGHRT